MRLACAALISGLSLPAQPLPDAADLLNRSASALKKYRSYQYESEMTIEMTMPGNPVRMNMTGSVAGVNPDKMRTESKSQMGAITIVVDGENTWIYTPTLKQYTKQAAVRGPQFFLESLGIRNAPDSSKLFKSAKTLRDESIEVDGNKHDCWVVEVRLDKLALPAPSNAEMTDAVMTLWIDKALSMNLRMSMSGKMRVGAMPNAIEMRQQMRLRALKFDVPLPDALFTFTPPEGAKEVTELAAPGMRKSDLTGKPAPAFRVKSLDGTLYDSAALKGKVVLLDFWATWCSPCRKEMPTLDRLYKDFQDQGLLILGLDAGEDRETVEKFLQTARVSYPIALTTDTDVVPAYEVSAFPTYVLIGRDGTIVGHQVGSSGERALRNLLTKAELKPAPAKAQ